MTKPLRFDVEAEEELGAAARWYESERPGLGGEFLASIEEVVVEIPKRPESFSLTPTVPENLGVRRVVVK